MPIRKVDLSDQYHHNEDFSFLEEEIIVQEGVYEETFAYDNQDEEYLLEHNKRRPRRCGMPPTSPKALIKDLVTSYLFDQIWSELIECSSDLIKAYAKAKFNSI
jgi:hypothetical protein